MGRRHPDSPAVKRVLVAFPGWALKTVKRKGDGTLQVVLMRNGRERIEEVRGR